MQANSPCHEARAGQQAPIINCRAVAEVSEKKAPLWTNAVQEAASGAAAGVKMGSGGALLRLEVYENLGHSHTL